MGFDLGYWVKSWSATWFFVFLLIEYYDEQCIYNFRMSNDTLFDITNKMRPLIAKKDAKICFTILVEVWLAYVIYKLFHGSNLLTYNKLFAISKSTIGFVIHEVVKVINMMFKSLISWPMGQNMEVVMLKLRISAVNQMYMVP